MARDHLVCAAGHHSWRDWPFKLQAWSDPSALPFKCPTCSEPMRWLGEWPPPKATPGQSRPFEVLYAALLDGEAPGGDRWASEEGYLPALILCAAPPCYVLWPRYWVKPGGHVRFGQDGPQLTVAEWDYLTEKVRRFAVARGIKL